MFNQLIFSSNLCSISISGLNGAYEETIAKWNYKKQLMFVQTVLVNFSIIFVLENFSRNVSKYVILKISEEVLNKFHSKTLLQHFSKLF